MMKATGKDFYRFNLKLGFKRIIVGVRYIRYYEYPLVFNNLAISKNIRILDVGCGRSLFPLFLAYHGCNVTALDINPIALSLIDLGGEIGVTGNLKVDISDGRNLPYPNNYFDRVCAISSIEHIPNDGDITTVKEMASVMIAEF